MVLYLDFKSIFQGNIIQLLEPQSCFWKQTHDFLSMSSGIELLIFFFQNPIFFNLFLLLEALIISILLIIVIQVSIFHYEWFFQFSSFQFQSFSFLPNSIFLILATFQRALQNYLKIPLLKFLLILFLYPF